MPPAHFYHNIFWHRSKQTQLVARRHGMEVTAAMYDVFSPGNIYYHHWNALIIMTGTMLRAEQEPRAIEF